MVELPPSCRPVAALVAAGAATGWRGDAVLPRELPPMVGASLVVAVAAAAAALAEDKGFVAAGKQRLARDTSPQTPLPGVGRQSDLQAASLPTPNDGEGRKMKRRNARDAKNEGRAESAASLRVDIGV